MSKQIREFRAKRANIIKQARGIVDTCDTEKRKMTDEERGNYDKAMKEIKSIDTEIADIERRAQLEDLENESQEEDERRSFQDPGEGNPNDEETRALENNYRSAFYKTIAFGQRASYSTDEVRALQSTPADQGGFLKAPQTLVNKVIKGLDKQIFIRSKATIFSNVKSSLGAPYLDNDLDDADWTSEVKTIKEDSNLRFGKRELEPKLLTKLVKAAILLVQSSTIDLESFIANRLIYKFGVTQEKAYLLGDGSKKALGVFVPSKDGISTSRDKTSSSATSINGDDILKMFYGLESGYRKNAEFIMHRNVWEEVLKAKDTAGNYLLNPFMQKDDSIRGKKVNLSEFAPNTIAANQYTMAFGDMSYYWIAEDGDIAIQTLLELFALNNLVGWIGRQKCDGMPVLEDAFIRLKQKSA